MILGIKLPKSRTVIPEATVNPVIITPVSKQDFTITTISLNFTG